MRLRAALLLAPVLAVACSSDEIPRDLALCTNAYVAITAFAAESWDQDRWDTFFDRFAEEWTEEEWAGWRDEMDARAAQYPGDGDFSGADDQHDLQLALMAFVHTASTTHLDGSTEFVYELDGQEQTISTPGDARGRELATQRLVAAYMLAEDACAREYPGFAD